MAKDNFNHGKNKILSSYGGVGSVVETTDGSVIIETFDNWGYSNILSSNEIEQYLIIDDRLLYRLKYIFKNLQHIVSVPDEYDRKVNPRANYFPKWFYCPKCKQFKEYYEWFNYWNEIGKDKKYFFPPKCSNKNCNEEILEQVRFVMTCPNGHIQDIPWKFWNNQTKEKPSEQDSFSDEEEDNGGSIFLDFSSKCCQNQKLVYSVSRENSELSGIHIECKSCGKAENLGGVFGFRMKCSGNEPWLGKNEHHNCEEKLKVVIKSSNSIYYANLISSIYIPVNQINLKQQHRVLISKWLDRGKLENEIIRDMKLDYDVPESETIKYLAGSENFISEQSFREVEYDYFLNNESVTDNSIKFSKINVNAKINGFDKVIRIEKLKQISVQTSFTRQMPIDLDAVLLNMEEDEFKKEFEVKRQSTSKNNINTLLLPGIESFGEAILFILEKDRIDKWCIDENIIKRADIIKNNALSSQRKFIRRKSENITPQFLLIHTLSHLIIKELEYVCGYPAASLQERLYISNNMLGFMIMAIEGTEGSLGGLVSQCDDLDNLNRIVNSAVERSKDCSSDPICENSEGQGVENLNLAACYSCSLLPDISCEEFNCFLDRRILIDEQFGFFKDTLTT